MDYRITILLLFSILPNLFCYCQRGKIVNFTGYYIEEYRIEDKTSNKHLTCTLCKSYLYKGKDTIAFLPNYNFNYYFLGSDSTLSLFLKKMEKNISENNSKKWHFTETPKEHWGLPIRLQNSEHHYLKKDCQNKIFVILKVKLSFISYNNYYQTYYSSPYFSKCHVQNNKASIDQCWGNFKDLPDIVSCLYEVKKIRKINMLKNRCFTPYSNSILVKECLWINSE